MLCRGARSAHRCEIVRDYSPGSCTFRAARYRYLPGIYENLMVPNALRYPAGGVYLFRLHLRSPPLLWQLHYRGTILFRESLVAIDGDDLR